MRGCKHEQLWPNESKVVGTGSNSRGTYNDVVVVVVGALEW